ncbi:MAG: HD domain-containing protein [Coriobacteriales bacterium]|nr:HD domain-containing protein [Coriobacteriales bacterium]
MEADRLARQMEFALAIDKEKQVQRQTHLMDWGRRENDAEHAWHMSVMAYLLREYANEPIDLARTLIMTLTHDLVEIYAGDVYAYDTQGRQEAPEREREAADRLFGMLPPDQARDLRDIWEEFERNDTPEARFAHAMDNVQPMMLNDANGGRDWRERKLPRSAPASRNDITRLGSAELAEHFDAILDAHVAAGNLHDE